MTMYLSRFRKDQTSASHSDSWSGFAVREIPHGMLSMLYSIYIHIIHIYYIIIYTYMGNLTRLCWAGKIWCIEII